MSGLIKSQLLKHLSKFTKNLSPDKIHVSTIRGEGELANLELDEVVLTEILDLPTWLRISKASCNRLNIKIQWTKLKSQPICLFLDEIEVVMETCDVIRTPSDGSPLSDLGGGGGKYGLAEKIVDGMYISINSVTVNFAAPKFNASIQMSRIVIQSKTPTWEQAADLRLTRIKDELRGQILLFKEAEWQTLRIEANALVSDQGDKLTSTPLRLIANQSKVRITMKKRLSDCGVVASRLLVSLDDLLWVLTDSQLKAAMLFVNSLKEIIQKSNHQSKLRAAEKVKKQGYQPPPNQSQASSKSQKSGSKSQQIVAKLFSKYDMRETSYHLHTARVDLHLCDDSIPDEGNRRKVEGGALQLTLLKLAFDFYPFHPAGAERSHWLRYDENMASRQAWAQDLLNAFREDVSKVRSALSTSRVQSPATGEPPSPIPPENTSSHGNNKHGGPPQQQGNNARKGQGQQTMNGKQSAAANVKGEGHAQGQRQGEGQGHQYPAATAQNHAHLFQAAKGTQLLENSMIVRLEDLVIYQVSSSTTSKNATPKKLLCSDKKALCLPPEMSSLHAEYTDYYFPDGIDFPVPSSNIFVVLNPLKLQVDFTTLVWLNAFLLSLQKTLELPEPEGPLLHTDVRVEALMPRVILPAECERPEQAERPNGLQLQASRVTLSNSRHGAKTTIGDLKQAVHLHDQAKMFTSGFGEFPCAMRELNPFPECVLNHLLGKDSAYLDKTLEQVLLTGQVPEELDKIADVMSPSQRRDEEWEVIEKKEKRRGVSRSDTAHSVSSMGLTYYSMRTDSLKRLASKDVWCVAVDQFWMEFIGVPASGNRPQPFLESFPITLWLFNPKQMNSSVLNSSVSMDTLREYPPPAPSGGTAHEQLNNIQSMTCNNDQSSLKQSHFSDREQSNNAKATDDGTNECDINSSQANHVINDASSARDSDMHIMLKIGGKISLQLSHHQFLFLMRLQESMTTLQSELKADQRFLTQRPIPEVALSVSLVVQEAEIALICPPIAELPSPDTSDGSSDFTIDDTMIDEKVAQYQNEHTVEGNNTADQTAAFSHNFGAVDFALTPVLAQRDHVLGEVTHVIDGVTSNDVASDVTVDDVISEEEVGMVATPEGVAISMSHQHFTSTSSLSTQFQTQHGGSPIPSPSLARRKASSQSQLSLETGYSSLGTSPRRHDTPPSQQRKPVDLKKSLNSGFNNFTKGFGKFTDKVKQTVRRDDDDDEWDRESQRSFSSDDEDRMLVQLENRPEMPAFDKNYSDFASEDESACLFDLMSAPEAKQKGVDLVEPQVVSIATFALGGIEAFVQLDGDDTIVSATVDRLFPEELGNVLLDKFQERFATAAKRAGLQLIDLEDTNVKDTKPPPASVDNPPIRLRFQQGPKAEKFSSVAKDRGFLKLCVSGLKSTLGLASLSGLSDLVEDEKHGPVMPMCVEVSDSFIILQDKRPPINDTSPGKLPMDVRISRVVLTRTEDGVFHVQGDTLPEDLKPDEKYTKATSMQTTPSLEFPADIPNNETSHHHLHPSIDTVIRPRTMSDQPDILGAVAGVEAGASSIAQLEGRVNTLQTENEQLRRQLERIGKMSSETGGIDFDSLQALQDECDSLRKRCKKLDQVKVEHKQLLQQTCAQGDEIKKLKCESHSLLTTIQLLQEELSDSENMRLRQNHAQ